MFVTHGDLTQIAADAVTFSTSTWQRFQGKMFGAFSDAFDIGTLFRQVKKEHKKRLRVGDALWLPLPSDSAPYGIVVMVATGTTKDAATLDTNRSLIVREAINCAVRELRGRGHEHRLLIALPLFRFGYGGDSANPLPSARQQVVAARQALDLLQQSSDWGNGVDVVFVAYTQDHYQVFLEARRLEKLQPLAELPSELAPLVRALKDQECVLFVGAGLSFGTGVPSYDALLTQMAERLGESLPEPKDYNTNLDFPQWFREARPGQMASLIADLYGPDKCVARPSLAHYLLLSLPFRYIITTNYDSLLETTLKALRRYPVTVVTDKEIARTGRREGTNVVKMHGDAASCQGANVLEDGIVISRDDYDQFFTKRPMMASLLEGLLLNQTFFFVGYSLRDPNFRQIHAKIAHTLQEAKRPTYATTFESLGKGALGQWHKKQVFLIPISSADGDTQQLRFFCLLDRIADEVAGDTHLLLARKPATDVSLTSKTSTVEHKLREVGVQLTKEVRIKLTPDQARPLARTLKFLSDQGWRPEKTSLTRLWEILATVADGKEEKSERLIYALAHAEKADVIARVRKSLQSLVD